MQLNPELQQIINLAQLSIDYFDALRPIVKNKFNIDLFDLVFFSIDPNPSSPNPIKYIGSDSNSNSKYSNSGHQIESCYLCGHNCPRSSCFNIQKGYDT